jgi:hypothetical protein
MACNNSPIIKYSVFLQEPRAPIPVPFPNVTNLSGLGFGTRDTVDVFTVGGKRTVVTDKVVIPTPEIEFRYATDPLAIAMKVILDRIWESGVKSVADIIVVICPKGAVSTYGYKYKDCQLKDYSENDKALGQANFSLIKTSWEPISVEPLGLFSGSNISRTFRSALWL